MGKVCAREAVVCRFCLSLSPTEARSQTVADRVDFPHPEKGWLARSGPLQPFSQVYILAPSSVVVRLVVAGWRLGECSISEIA